MNIIKWILWLPVYAVCVLLYAACLIVGSLLLRIYYVLLIVAGVGTVIFLEHHCPMPQWLKNCMGAAGLANAVLFVIIGYKIRKGVTKFCVKQFDRLKNVVENYKTNRKYVDFDLNQILDCPDASLAVNWEEAAEVLYLYYHQWEYRNALEELTEPQKIFFLVHNFSCRIVPSHLERGGFPSFLQKLSTELIHSTVRALQTVRAFETAELLQESINADERGQNKNTKQYLTKICKSERLLDLELDYVRQNKEHFRQEKPTP